MIISQKRFNMKKIAVISPSIFIPFHNFLMKDHSETFILTPKTNFEKIVDLKVLCNLTRVTLHEWSDLSRNTILLVTRNLKC